MSSHKAQIKYNNSVKGFEARLRYRKSQKFKDRIKKMKATPEYKKEAKLYKENYYLSWKYNLTLEQFNAILLSQNGCCAICKKHQSEFKKKFGVDHDHKTKKNREILCHKCNSMIGFAEDNVDRLLLGIEYLKKHKEE